MQSVSFSPDGPNVAAVPRAIITEFQRSIKRFHDITSSTLHTPFQNSLRSHGTSAVPGTLRQDMLRNCILADLFAWLIDIADGNVLAVSDSAVTTKCAEFANLVEQAMEDVSTDASLSARGLFLQGCKETKR